MQTHVTTDYSTLLHTKVSKKQKQTKTKLVAEPSEAPGPGALQLPPPLSPCPFLPGPPARRPLATASPRLRSPARAASLGNKVTAQPGPSEGQRGARPSAAALCNAAASLRAASPPPPHLLAVGRPAVAAAPGVAAAAGEDHRDGRARGSLAGRGRRAGAGVARGAAAAPGTPFRRAAAAGGGCSSGRRLLLRPRPPDSPKSAARRRERLGQLGGPPPRVPWTGVRAGSWRRSGLSRRQRRSSAAGPHLPWPQPPP